LGEQLDFLPSVEGAADGGVVYAAKPLPFVAQPANVIATTEPFETDP
jgi:hypothetical protein